MTKYKNTPRLLTGKLNTKQFSAVKSHASAFIKKAKKKYNGKLPASIDLSRDYVEYLADREPDYFGGVDAERLHYKQVGFKQLYDHLRKKIGRHDEEKPTPAGALANTPKGALPKPYTPEKAKTAKGEPPAQVQSHGNFEGHREEQEMPLRQAVDSFHEESDHEAGDQGEPSDSSVSIPSGTSNASEKGLGKRKFLGLKRHFIALLDACDEDNIGRFTYKALFSNSGPHLTYDEQVPMENW